MRQRAELDVDKLVRGDRATLARAITLIESKHPADRAAARRLIEAVLPRTGRAIRVGVTGVPGVGKSTLIDTLGSNLTADGLKVAVLAVDPSSTRTGGAILADKTRMARLAADDNAFIRPSPSSGTLGGVAAKTRESMFLAEAAGYDVILVETVGVGQSEIAVADLTDFFLVLMLPGGGDEIQGLKKGVVELADMIAVNKADGEGAAPAKATAAEYRAALHILTAASAAWSPPVVTVSGRFNQGLDAIWSAVLQHRAKLGATGELEKKRRAQDLKWMWAMVEERMRARLAHDRATRERVGALEQRVTEGALSPSGAADEIAALLGL
jgi:LAO/AO transport system kinase